MTDRTPDEVLESALYVGLTEAITDGVKVSDKEGNISTVTAPAAYFSAAVALLKAKGEKTPASISPEETSEALQAMKEKLAFGRTKRPAVTN